MLAREEIDKDSTQSIYNTLSVPHHIHNDADAPAVNFADISARKQAVWWTLPGITAATATNYGVIFIAPFPCIVVGVTEVHQTLGTDAGAVTLQIEKLISTQAPDAGVALLRNAFNLKGTINTVQTGVMITTTIGNIPYVNLATGDRLCLKDTGVLTSVANLTVVIMLQY